VRGESYTEQTDFNIPNQTEDTETSISSDSDSVIYEPSSGTDEKEGEEDITETEFTLDQTGVIRIYAAISGADDLTQIYGYVVDPAGDTYTMSTAGESIEITFDAIESGKYTIQLYNLGTATAEISVNYVD
jgi:hypothetical protein